MHDAEGLADGALQSARPRRIQPFDFRRTTRFSGEQQARLRGLALEVGRAAATALAGDLRTPVAIELIAVDQTTWGAALATAAPGSLCAPLEVTEELPPLLLVSELPFLLRAIDRAVGGDGSTEPRERSLTELDLRLAARLFGAVQRGLDAEWHEVTGARVELGSLGPVTGAAALAAPGEPSLAITFEARLDGTASVLTLLLAHATVSAFPGLAEAHQPDRRDPGPARAALERTLSRATVTVRAEVASQPMTVAEVLTLREGDVLAFARLADQGVTLHVGDKETHRAQPGRQGRRRAVQVVERLPDAPATLPPSGRGTAA